MEEVEDEVGGDMEEVKDEKWESKKAEGRQGGRRSEEVEKRIQADTGFARPNKAHQRCFEVLLNRTVCQILNTSISQV